MKFNGSNWVAVGSIGFSSAYSKYTSLAIASDGTPYVAYQDGNNNNQASVMKFDGTGWVAVGNPEFSTGSATYLSLAIAPSGSPDAGKPYVTYSDAALGGKASVMKFDGANWVAVGTDGFSVDAATSNSFAFATDGAPYVAYQDYGNGGRATVKKFNGTNWTDVGSAGFSAAGANYTSLSLASDGTPYVAYIDASISNKASVKKFNGSNWVTVGSAGFSTQWSVQTALAITANGTPYVAYLDGIFTTPSAKNFTFGPILASTVPADNATNVSPGGTIALTFSAATSIGSGNLKIVNDSDSTTETINVAAADSGTFAWNGNTLTITPGTPLAASKSYHVEIDAGTFLNAANEPYAGIAGPTTLNFSVSAASAPNQPTGVTATSGNTQISVAFTPGSDGGSAINGYTASCTSSDGSSDGSNTGTASPIVVSALSNDKTYTCTVTASNAIGTGTASSPSASAMPALPLSAITVTSIADSGAGSLRQALLDVAAGGTITFDPAIANQTITLTSTLAVDKSVTIDGGSQNLTVSGNNAVRVFNIADGATVTLQKLTIANGNNDTDGGGGIRNGNGNGTLTLNQVILSGNAGTGAGGGGLYNAGGAVTISNSLFTGNSASDGGGVRNSGGTLNL
ncbi:MAG: Ig-like domain-containing protein, partial [Sulfuricellaceae bacterium]